MTIAVGSLLACVALACVCAVQDKREDRGVMSFICLVLMFAIGTVAAVSEGWGICYHSPERIATQIVRLREQASKGEAAARGFRKRVDKLVLPGKAK